MASIISDSSEAVTYKDSRSDWILTANLDPFYMKVTGIENMCGMEFASGVNLDSLVEVITFAKNDLTSRGVNWENN